MWSLIPGGPKCETKKNHRTYIVSWPEFWDIFSSNADFCIEWWWFSIALLVRSDEGSKVCVTIGYSRKHVAERFPVKRLDVAPKCCCVLEEGQSVKVTKQADANFFLLVNRWKLTSIPEMVASFQIWLFWLSILISGKYSARCHPNLIVSSLWVWQGPSNFPASWD